MKRNRIESILNNSFSTLTTLNTVEDTLEAMRINDFIVIVDTNNEPIGIFTEHNALEIITKNNKASIPLADVMNKEILCVYKNSSIDNAYELMREKELKYIIILNKNNTFAGVVVESDFLKYMSAQETLLKQQKDKLERLANYDLLTNLPNKLLFEKILKKSIANAVRNNYYTAFVLLNLDRFKDINDSYGHNFGDELLIHISDILVQSVREGDIIARIGNDEFAIILEHIKDDRDIAVVINKILKKIKEPIILSNDIEVNIESSAGVAIVPKDSKDIEKLFQYVESALSQAKKDGHGLYKFYTEEMTQDAIKKIAYENAMRNAIDNNEIELYYQPQIDIKTEKIVGAEALLRWRLADKTIPPSIFIPIANETGLINHLGNWVLNKACEQGKIWLDKGYDLSISINISTNQVKYQNIPELVSKIIHKTQFKAQKLKLEITENALTRREDESIKMLNALKKQGIQISIDNFGTGYSSLTSLKELPIDILKIDKSFIDNIAYKEESIALVAAIIKMGKALGFQILAQGVEQKEQLNALKEKDCDTYQGFVHSKAVSSKEFEKLLEN